MNDLMWGRDKTRQDETRQLKQLPAPPSSFSPCQGSTINHQPPLCHISSSPPHLPRNPHTSNSAEPCLQVLAKTWSRQLGQDGTWWDEEKRTISNATEPGEA
ncbi:hypothetical protein VE01_10802 [Pseudogymnoascus verrucosus]|uniref:Uncharacterized protein n=1 Tax=Pseudogymnoascus verrucosus TaxID=342668 RepID=A0A2P6FGY6_9PEZI|nr:uncharacterized protein VE01_10802 [Pseudogymnoascus verrucosus]PQM43906.1 hypothetical protein VE01_10802 [Pseudogymnoascus verrucosus]